MICHTQLPASNKHWDGYKVNNLQFAVLSLVPKVLLLSLAWLVFFTLLH